MSPSSAAVIALVLLAAFGLLGFGWRAWLQHRRTGSTGIRGTRGRLGVMERVAAAGFAAALAVTVLGPTLQWASVVRPVDVRLQILGIALATLGIALTVWAQLDMGDSWRVGVDADETTELVQGKVFGWVRNPIYSAMLVFELGIALLTPNVVTLAALVMAIVSLELQVRRVEEPYLLAKHGAAYQDYVSRVGRFVPGVGLIR